MKKIKKYPILLFGENEYNIESDSEENAMKKAKSLFKDNILLGYRQYAWIKDLEKNSHRQMKGSLGRKNLNSREYKACCLGESILTKCRIQRTMFPFYYIESISTETYLKSQDGRTSYLSIPDFKYFNLINGAGRIDVNNINEISNNIALVKNRSVTLSLTVLNDSGISWKEIAQFIKSNPKAVFTSPI